MKTRTIVGFGFVLHVTVTACGDPDRPSHLGSDSGTTGGPDAGNVQQEAGASISDSGAEVPLVVAPTTPDLAPCTSPYAPVLEFVPAVATLPVFANPSEGLSVGTAGAGASSPSGWSDSASVNLPAEDSTISLFAKLSATVCPDAIEFAHEYSVRRSFAPAAGQPGSSAIAENDARLSAWATEVLAVSYGENVDASWQTPDKALGPATGDTTDIVSLGEGGTITLGFDATLVDGSGYDFAVFENGFSDEYLELAYVEVSSDGEHFVRFDTASLVTGPVGPYGTLDPRELEGYAGKYRVGFGTPFDLAWLKARPEVQSGLVNLSQITSVRIVDVIGDVRNRDSFGHVVYDPYPTTGSAGFDLEAIGLLNVAP
jgi:hypothetical protein